MILKFATKKDCCGNRYYLYLDTDKKTYSRSLVWFHREDFIEVTQKDYRKALASARGAGWKEEG